MLPFCFRFDTLSDQLLGPVAVCDTATGECWIYPNPELLRWSFSRWLG
jgi:hypothetical protein